MLRVGIAGLGRMGKLNLLSAIRNREVNLVAAADLKKSNRKAAEKFNIKTYDDYKHLIETENLDAVIISLPNFLKKESILFAAEKGLGVYVDKPLAATFSDAEEIKNIVQSKKIQMIVGVNYRFFESIQKITSIFDAGEIGDAIIASGELIMGGPFSHPLVPKPVPEWWFSKDKSGGGALLDLGYHLIDIFSWIFGDMKLEFSKLGYRFGLPVEDSAIAVLKSKKAGVTCILDVGWFSKMIFPDFNFRVNLHGTVGYTSTDHYAPQRPYYHAAKEAISNMFKKILRRKICFLSYTYYYASFVKILDHFFDVMNDKVEPMISLESQLTVVKTINDIYSGALV